MNTHAPGATMPGADALSGNVAHIDANICEAEMRARNLPAMIKRWPRLALESLARAHTRKAIRTLVGIMNEPQSPPMARIAAAKILLDRGWGPPAPFNEMPATQPLTKIVNEFVHVYKTREELAREQEPLLLGESGAKTKL